jgi:hypothetical protein
MHGWTGITYSNNAGVGQCCSGGPNPAMNQDTNTLRFSYGNGIATQVIGVNNALSAAGTGIKVTGFNYSWMIYNDLNNSGGTRGNISASVAVTNNANKVVESYNYDYSQTNTGGDFRTFAGTETFSKLYSPSSLGNLTVSFTGNDKNWWAGYYGPRVRNASIGLNYSAGGSPDPSPSPSPTPPKASATTTVTATDTSGTASLTAPAAMADPTKNDVTSANAGGVQVSTTGEITPIVNVPKFVRDANDIGEKLKEKEKPKLVSKPAVVAIPVPSRRVENVVVDIAKFTTQEAAPQAVEKQETTSIKIQTQELVQQQIKSTVAAAASAKRNISNSYEADQDSETVGTVAKITNQFSLALGRGQGLRMDDVPAPVRQSMMSATSPLNSYLTMVPSENAPDQKSTVKSNVQNNELAGGVDLSKIAIQPVGFADYMTLALTDAAFYGPKEAYPNQRVVDNARAQRLLQGASDRLHQEMVNSQYNKEPK